MTCACVGISCTAALFYSVAHVLVFRLNPIHSWWIITCELTADVHAKNNQTSPRQGRLMLSWSAFMEPKTQSFPAPPQLYHSFSPKLGFLKSLRKKNGSHIFCIDCPSSLMCLLLKMHQLWLAIHKQNFKSDFI